MIRRMLARLSPKARRWCGAGAWIIGALLLALVATRFVARSYQVSGISMEPTLHTGDIVVANKLGKTWSNLFGREFVPPRNALIVFKNPFYNQGDPQTFVVKRIIGLPGDHVIVRDGRITIYPADNPSYSINPDEGVAGPQNPTSGTVDRTVPDNELFIVGDNRQGDNSLDSRNGMSTIPVKDVQGTVMIRFWPLNSIRFF